jgi:septum formation protein
VKAIKAIVLASASPRRRELLGLLGVPFTVRAVEVDETARPGETPEVLVARLSATKAAAVARGLKDGLVVAADTVVALEGEILGKPRDAAHAVEMLRRLRDRVHSVHSGVTVVDVASGRATIHLSDTAVWMRDYDDAEIETYVAGGDPLDKAGAYAIQHADFRPVARIQGCFTGVVGLPLGALSDGLAHFGVVLPVDLAAVCRGWTGFPCCREKS